MAHLTKPIVIPSQENSKVGIIVMQRSGKLIFTFDTWGTWWQMPDIPIDNQEVYTDYKVDSADLDIRIDGLLLYIAVKRINRLFSFRHDHIRYKLS